MTGAELIKLIKENNLEEVDLMANNGDIHTAYSFSEISDDPEKEICIIHLYKQDHEAFPGLDDIPNNVYELSEEEIDRIRDDLYNQIMYDESCKPFKQVDHMSLAAFNFFYEGA